MKALDYAAWMFGFLMVFLVGTMLIAFACALYDNLAWRRYRNKRHLLTRHILPEAGQRWRQGSDVLEIIEIWDNGRVAIRSGEYSWSETPHQWAERVRNRKLYLIS